MGCGGSRVGRANMTAVLREHSAPSACPPAPLTGPGRAGELRALVGPRVLLYSNDCVHSQGSSLHPKGGKPGMHYSVDLLTVPPELNLISMDCCE